LSHPAMPYADYSTHTRTGVPMEAAGAAGLAALLPFIIYLILFILIVLAWYNAKKASDLIQNASWNNPNQQAQALDAANKAKNYAGVVWIAQVVLWLLGLAAVAFFGAALFNLAKFGSRQMGRMAEPSYGSYASRYGSW